jgi:hypothetical protein
VDTVVFLSGTTRGGTLEGIGRSFGAGFTALGLRFVEVSLLDQVRFLETMRTLDFQHVRLVFSWVSMGMELAMTRPDGSSFNPWQEMGIPFISIHGDSPAYFFDRHVVRDSHFISLYCYAEHCALRRRLPLVRGPLETIWPILLDEVPITEIDFKAKRHGKLLFLKNGKNPASIRRLWASFLEPTLLNAIMEIASELEHHLGDPVVQQTEVPQIDDLVTRYFTERDFDIGPLLKLRLLFIAQLDDYVRAVKGTLMAEALMDFPVEIRGNNWGYLDFTGKRAQCIDECDYVKSVGLIRRALGTIDMSPNTSSRPHDRPMRAYGAHTLCLTNEQEFQQHLPHGKLLSFSFSRESLQEKVASLLANKEAAIEMGIEVAAAYRQQHPPEQLCRKMLDCAALVRLNHLPQRPPGMQDFVVWPPQQL